MNSGMIGKIEKAHRYAEEPDRFTMRSFTVTVHGNNSDHEVTYSEGQWFCECDFFTHQQCCAHTMALELLLKNMVQSSSFPAAAVA